MYLIKNKLLETISPVFVLHFHSLKIVCAQALQHVVSHESLLNKHLGHRAKSLGTTGLRGGERGTCLRPLFSGAPSRCFACNFSFLVKSVLSTLISTLLKKGPQQQLQCVGTLLSNGPSTAIVMRKYFLFCLWRGPNSSCNV